jgi:hypothetical protein
MSWTFKFDWQQEDLAKLQVLLLQVVRLMKQKEEKLLQAQRTRTLINVEGQHLLR